MKIKKQDRHLRNYLSLYSKIADSADIRLSEKGLLIGSAMSCLQNVSSFTSYNPQLLFISNCFTFLTPSPAS